MRNYGGLTIHFASRLDRPCSPFGSNFGQLQTATCRTLFLSNSLAAIPSSQIATSGHFRLTEFLTEKVNKALRSNLF
jgi:hypothetical protein